MYWQDHMPPHFHAYYGGEEVLISIKDLEAIEALLIQSLEGCYLKKCDS